jgi:hypothetical protein
MKVSRLTMLAALVATMLTQCKKDDFNNPFFDGRQAFMNGKMTPGSTYTITVENISKPYLFFEAGVASIPEGKSEPAPALQGESFKFSFHAGPQHKLSFATMYGWSNDGFYAPGGNGISLYSGDNPITGDITSQVMLWDAGTEMNQMPGPGNAHDGASTNDAVQLMSAVGDGYNYGMVNTNLKVSLEYNGNSLFTVTIDNLNASTTAISPVAWVVHSTANPLFEAGMADYGKGLEELAETGNATPLGDYLTMNSGYVSPVAPVLWVLHDKKEYPIFTEGSPDYGIGLEALAETGNPEPLYESLKAEGYETGFEAIQTNGSSGPLFPGQKYSFTINGHVGQSLSIACMLGASNDIFFSFGDQGLKLSDGVAELNLTHFIELYDAGTEVNEYPGAQTQANTVENGVVRKLDDGLPWPEASRVIKVTLKKN